MSRDDFLYVAKKNGRYVIVNRPCDDWYQGIRADEVVVADATEPSSAVLLANRIHWQTPTTHGVQVSDRVARELGWRLNR